MGVNDLQTRRGQGQVQKKIDRSHSLVGQSCSDSYSLISRRIIRIQPPNLKLVMYTHNENCPPFSLT